MSELSEIEVAPYEDSVKEVVVTIPQRLKRGWDEYLGYTTWLPDVDKENK